MKVELYPLVGSDAALTPHTNVGYKYEPNLVSQAQQVTPLTSFTCVGLFRWTGSEKLQRFVTPTART